MSWQRMRPLIGILMGIMLVLEMFYMLTGDFLHEVVGALFFLALVAHIVLSRNWIKGIALKARHRQKLSFKQKAQTGTVVLLVVALALLLISSVLISDILSATTGWAFTGPFYSMLVLVHTTCAYAVCIATICHVGLHWVSLFKSLKIPYDPRRRKAIGTVVTTLASVGVVAVGLAAAKEIASWDTLARSAGSSEEKSEGSRAERRSGRKADASGAAEESGSADNAPFSGSESRGKGRGQGESGSDSSRSGSSDSGSADSNSSGSGGADSRDSDSATPNSSDSNPSGPSSSGSGASGSNSGICTLCKKRCSLSAPKCNKPYAAGLI